MANKMKEPEVVNAVKIHLESFPDVEGIADEVLLVKDGLTCDVVGYSNERIKYIVECKGELSPGGIAGGIGQAYQYKHQKKFLRRVDLNSEIIFACPFDMKNSLDLMTIPTEIKEVWLVDNDFRIHVYKKPRRDNSEILLHITGTVYLESFSLANLKVILHTIAKHENSSGGLNLKDKLMKDIPQLNDPRNLFIGLNKLGLTVNKKLTPKGYKLYGHLKQSESDFERELIKILTPTFNVVLNAIMKISKDTNQSLNKIKFTYKELESKNEEIFGEKVNYFDHRRLSYIVNLLCDLKFLTKLKGNSKYRVEKISVN